MVAFPELVLIPVHTRMDEDVYKKESHPKLVINLELLFTFVDPSANDTTIQDGQLPQIDEWHRDGKALVRSLFTTAMVEVADKTFAELLPSCVGNYKAN